MRNGLNEPRENFIGTDVVWGGEGGKSSINYAPHSLHPRAYRANIQIVIRKP